MTFEEILARWNGGTLRGAQTRLAKRLGVAPNTVSQWTTGVSRPDEDLRPKVARELGLSVQVLDRFFVPRRRSENAWRDAGRSDPGASVPVFGPVTEEPFSFDFDSGVPEELLPLTVGAGYGGRSAALRVKGGHWSPLAEDGDYLLLSECSAAPDGKWVVVRRGDGCRLRRIKSGPGRSDARERVLAAVVGRFRRV